MPSERDLNLDVLMDAFNDYQKAKAEYDEAFESCDHSWGYYGQRYEDALEQARTAIGLRLREMIRAEVVAALAASAPAGEGGGKR